MIADTSGLLALFNRSEPAHDRVRAAVQAAAEPLVVSPHVVAEIDYLVATRLGVDAELAELAELAGGAYELPAIGAADLAACADIVTRYWDQDIGVADSSLVVLAHRYGTRSILTLDRRHIEVLRPIGGGRFKIVGA